MCWECLTRGKLTRRLALSLRRLPCLRHQINDVVVSLDVQKPYRAFGEKNGHTWSPSGADWASSDVHVVKLYELSFGVTCTLEVREFAARSDQTLMQEIWSDGLGKRTHQTPPYAIGDIEQARRSLADLIGRKVANYIIANLGEGDRLAWSVYYLAFRQVKRAKVC